MSITYFSLLLSHCSINQRLSDVDLSKAMFADLPNMTTHKIFASNPRLRRPQVTADTPGILESRRKKELVNHGERDGRPDRGVVSGRCEQRVIRPKLQLTIITVQDADQQLP